MRSLIGLAILVVSTSAYAGSRTESGGGGRLGQVSGGLGKATGGGGGSGGGASTQPDRGTPSYDGMYTRYRDANDQVIIVDYDGNIVRRIPPPAVRETHREGAGVTLFIGVQKVIESDTAASAKLAVTDDWFRLSGTIARFWEDRMDGQGKLTLTMGSLALGIPVQQGGRTRTFLEGGVVYAKTANDPMVDTSITGAKAGLHLERGLRTVTLLGDAHGLFFPDGVRAFEGRVGVRYKNFEAAFRALDFNVGPALYGPEVGISF